MSRLDGASLVETVTSAVNGIVRPFSTRVENFKISGMKNPPHGSGGKLSKKKSKKVAMIWLQYIV